VQSRGCRTIRPDVLRDERKRRELEDEGWNIERIPLDLTRLHPGAFIERVRSDLAAARRSSS
jgi:hypothetical protein